MVKCLCQELQAAQKRVGQQQLPRRRQPNGHLVPANLQLDLGGIAKGYAVDEVMAVLKANGIARAYVAWTAICSPGPPPVVVAEDRLQCR